VKSRHEMMEGQSGLVIDQLFKFFGNNTNCTNWEYVLLPPLILLRYEEIPFCLYFALQYDHWITQSPAREL